MYDTENKDIYRDTFQLLHCGENERNVHCIRFVQLSVLIKCIRTISVFRRRKKDSLMRVFTVYHKQTNHSKDLLLVRVYQIGNELETELGLRSFVRILP